MSKNDEVHPAVVVGVLLFVAVIFCICYFSERKTINKYGEEKYEIVILDKWDDLGSNYHLIGGRSTETEYHIHYKYRCTNRPDDSFKSKWHDRTTEVSYPKYKSYQVGKRYISDSQWLSW